ncbi:MAG: alanine/ornithine racemase family PLP-dependent enzyme [Maricaulaceae bacterium]|jgi:predicted amino acid racemase
MSAATPEISIDLTKLSVNVRIVKAMLDARGVELVGVTKVFGGDPAIAQVYIDAGVRTLGDSRVANLERLAGLPGRKMLLRAPPLREIDDAARLADIVLVSHAETAERLAASARRQGLRRGVILMADLGDLREGAYDASDLLDAARRIAAIPDLSFEGLGANFGCLGAVLPSETNMNRLRQLKRDVEAEIGAELGVLSAGNSSSLHLLGDGNALAEVNQLRVGEAIVTGRETARDELLPGAHEDCFVLRAEIIEKHRKPSAPVGATGRDGFGRSLRFADRGVRWRALCAVGRQDVDVDQITPLDANIEIVGDSSDHLVLDVEACADRMRVGDAVEFSLRYGGVLRAMTSPSVAKRMV